MAGVKRMGIKEEGQRAKDIIEVCPRQDMKGEDGDIPEFQRHRFALNWTAETWAWRSRTSGT